MKNLSREQRYEMKMNFFSEVSVRELASKLLVAIIAICVIINGADHRRNEISNIVYTNPFTISSSEGIIFMMMVLDTFVLLVRRRFLSCLVIHLYSYVRVH